MKKQLKDRKHTEATIKIDKVREVFKDGNSTEFRDKLICIKISYPWGSIISTCFKDNKKGRKDLLNWIGEELYLKQRKKEGVRNG